MPETIKHLHVICYKWGTLYGPEYVNILAHMVKRHLSIPHTFHCITDEPEGLVPEIKTHDIPDLGFEGIWRKLMTFDENFLDLKGQFVVSIDIDVVIVDSLDFLADEPTKDFVIARNWSQSEIRGSGSLYRLKVGSQPEIWNKFIADPEAAIDQHHGKTRLIGEQKWLNTHIREFNFFPEGKVVSYKRHCQAKGRILKIAGIEIFNTAHYGKAAPPSGASLVSFHGDPSPQEVTNQHHGRWRHAPFVGKYWK
jgi:hypothetical protein